MTQDDPSREIDRPAGADWRRSLQSFTPARVALGRPGSAQPTAAGLRFALDHARARDAVHAPLDFEAMRLSLTERGWRVIHVRSAAGDRAEYLRRPDLGRLLSAAGRSLVASQPGTADVAVVAADGLSSLAIETNLASVLDPLRPLLSAQRLTIGPLVLVEQGRVAIADQIGELLGAKLSVILIGERPGLSAADSLGAYITWRPRTGTMDSGRTCISNVRAAGLSPKDAATQIAAAVGLAFKYAATGVRLNDLRGGEALGAPKA